MYVGGVLTPAVSAPVVCAFQAVDDATASTVCNVTESQLLHLLSGHAFVVLSAGAASREVVRAQVVFDDRGGTTCLTVVGSPWDVGPVHGVASMQQSSPGAPNTTVPLEVSIMLAPSADFGPVVLLLLHGDGPLCDLAPQGNSSLAAVTWVCDLPVPRIPLLLSNAAVLEVVAANGTTTLRGLVLVSSALDFASLVPTQLSGGSVVPPSALETLAAAVVIPALHASVAVVFAMTAGALWTSCCRTRLGLMFIVL